MSRSEKHSNIAPMALQAAGTGTAPVKVLDKALRVLDLFTVARPEWTASEMARELGQPVPTIHRIMRSLEDHGYLMRAAAGYRLGMSAVELGRRAIDSLDLRTAARPVVRSLAEATGETVLLSIYSEARGGALCVDRIEASHSLRLSLDVGRVTPLHAGASAKALLAYLPTTVIEEVLSGSLKPYGPNTIVDPSALRRELEEICARGWATSYEENDAGAWGVSAPILNPKGAVVASLGIAAPTIRFSASVEREMVSAVKDAAAAAADILAPARLRR
jgi:DNA-binding IclR family transcriptional regulator